MLISLLMINLAFPMAMQIKSPPKGITLKFKTIAVYDFLDSKKYACEALEVFDIYGLTFNGGVATEITDFGEQASYIGAIMYDFKSFPELAEQFPPSKPLSWVIEQINKIPCVELEAGICGIYSPDNDEREWSVGGALNVIKVQW